MGTILLIVFKFSTANSFFVFPTELKDMSGSSPSCIASIQIEWQWL